MKNLGKRAQVYADAQIDVMTRVVQAYVDLASLNYQPPSLHQMQV